MGDVPKLLPKGIAERESKTREGARLGVSVKQS